jgi:arginine decarboxylase-like protein
MAGIRIPFLLYFTLFVIKTIEKMKSRFIKYRIAIEYCNNYENMALKLPITCNIYEIFVNPTLTKHYEKISDLSGAATSH